VDDVIFIVIILAFFGLAMLLVRMLRRVVLAGHADEVEDGSTFGDSPSEP
jgi:hypothetical protein